MNNSARPTIALLLWVPLALGIAGCHSAARATGAKIFSDIVGNEETGDRVGARLRLTFSATSASGVLEVWEGWNHNEYLLQGTVDGSAVNMKGFFDGGEVLVRGELRAEGFLGSASFRLKEQTNTVDLRLREEHDARRTAH